MEIINLSRCGGKTTALVYASAIDKVHILCLNIEKAKYIKNLAKKLGVRIPEPIVCTSTDIRFLGSPAFDKILIDDAEFTIPALIKTLTGTEIKGMTMSVPMVSPACISTDKPKTFEETAEELMNTIKMRSFDEAAEDTAKFFAEMWRKFGFSID